MMAFIINSFLDSNTTEKFAISGKKQFNTWWYINTQYAPVDQSF